MKAVLKSAIHAFCVALVFVPALSSGFGRIEGIFTFWGQYLSTFPGLPGDYLRIAYYCLTLEACHRESRIQFGSYFAHSNARVAKGVYIGTYCILGCVHIGERTEIASAVQVLSGRKQHPRDQQGRLMGSEHGVFTTVRIGSDCWIGAQAIVMADIGQGSTVGAGSVVTSSVSPGTVAVGNPARPLPPKAGPGVGAGAESGA